MPKNLCWISHVLASPWDLFQISVARGVTSRGGMNLARGPRHRFMDSDYVFVPRQTQQTNQHQRLTTRVAFAGELLYSKLHIWKTLPCKTEGSPSWSLAAARCNAVHDSGFRAPTSAPAARRALMTPWLCLRFEHARIRAVWPSSSTALTWALWLNS